MNGCIIPAIIYVEIGGVVDRGLFDRGVGEKQRLMLFFKVTVNRYGIVEGINMNGCMIPAILIRAGKSMIPV